jgi:tetratricopeptide (TPR) repeat protein
MVSFDVRQIVTLAGGAFALAFGASTALSQALEPRQTAIVDSIADIESRAGPLAADLINPLRSLSAIYFEGGDLDQAAASADRALQVMRANYGADSLEQVPLLRHVMRIQRARGDDAAAWVTRQQLAGLAERNAHDLRAVPLLRELAAQRTSPEARDYYEQAIGLLIRRDQYAGDEIVGLEMGLLNNSYVLHDYDAGRQALIRLAAYEVTRAVPALDRIASLVRLADWDLMFGKQREAYAGYATAYEMLEREGIDSASADGLFSPDIPVTLPTFFRNPLVSKQTSFTSGHIDVAFDIQRHGIPADVRILDTTTSGDEIVKRYLLSTIERSRFRPVMIQGRVERASVVVRYYVNK